MDIFESDEWEERKEGRKEGRREGKRFRRRRGKAQLPSGGLLLGGEREREGKGGGNTQRRATVATNILGWFGDGQTVWETLEENALMELRAIFS